MWFPAAPPDVSTIIGQMCDRRRGADLSPALSRINDWASFESALERHKLGSLALEWMEHESIEEIPESIRSMLSDRKERVKEFQQESAETLFPILDTLESKGIKCIVLKGFDLMNRVYTSPEMRPMGDVDLLVKPSELDAVLTVFMEAGFVPTESARQLRMLRLFHYELGLLKGELFIDLHWDLEHRLTIHKFDLEAIMDRAERVRTSFGSYWGMEWTDLFCYVVFHFDHHTNYRLIGLPRDPIVDILSRGPEVIFALPKLVWLNDVVTMLEIDPHLLERPVFHRRTTELLFDEGMAYVLRCSALAFPQRMRRFEQGINAFCTTVLANRETRIREKGAFPKFLYEDFLGLKLRPIRFLELAEIMWPSGSQLSQMYKRFSGPRAALRIYHLCMTAFLFAGISLHLTVLIALDRTAGVFPGWLKH